jgi:DNA invertase Pin-like site-specific DNA recombinase
MAPLVKKNRTPDADGAHSPSRRAAAYVRMSKDQQKYSIENQMAAITHYAHQHNIEIVSQYSDGGRSGLNFKGRKGLRQLIADVQAGQAEFEVILVLDVTRWGRFQDVDESGYYEFICRKAGIQVHYVGEEFVNDGSPMGAFVKAAKRSMAGEYSRELSKKVFTGQCRLIQKGYRQGGLAGYGLRRLMVDEHGQPRLELKRGEHKSLQTDRVILIPGPPEEVETVQWIYRAFAEEGLRESQIAAILNRRGILTDLERAWTRGTVHQILTNEKYIGNNVFNRTSFKLKQIHTVNPPEEWVRADGVFKPVVESRYFYTAQGIIRERSRKLSDDEMLAKLKLLHERQGWLSGIIIDETEDMPSSSAYHHRFGSLLRAYQLIGFTPDHDYRYIEINQYLRSLHKDTVDDTVHKIEKLGGSVRQETPSELLIINEELKASVVICRCQQTDAGSYRWNIRLDTGLLPDITIAIRMDAANKKAFDYYLLPALDIENPKMRLAEHNGLALDAYRFDDLDAFFLLTERVSLWEAA